MIQAVEKEVNQLLLTAEANAKRILKENQGELHRLAQVYHCTAHCLLNAHMFEASPASAATVCSLISLLTGRSDEKGCNWIVRTACLTSRDLGHVRDS